MNSHRPGGPRLPRPPIIVWLVALAITAGLAQPLVFAPSPASAQAQLTATVIRTDGVEGRVTSQANPLVDAEVWDIEFIGNTAYVAGKFQQVVRATTDWSRVDQPFLAAFDASTGQWISSFTPQLDGPVWALEEGPNGILYAGGEFTTVNGDSQTGLVALDPSTGATDNGFAGLVERRYSTNLAVVRDLHRRGDQLYAIGNFSHAIGGTTTMQAAKVARFDTNTGKPDVAWVPELSGSSGWAIDVSDDGQRVFLGGEFNYVNGEADTELFAAVDSSTGSLVAGFDNGFNASKQAFWPVGGIVYDLAVSGSRVYLSGAEHFWEARSSANGQSIQLTTTYNGNWFNDTQVTELEAGTIFIGCHCIRHWGYANHDIDPATGTITGSLTAGMSGGEGVWALDEAPDGCLWMGGDLRGTESVYGAPVDGTTRWVGRFARFCGPNGPPPPPQLEFELIPPGSTWDVLAAPQWPAGWSETTFDVAAWSSGQAEFGYGDGTEVTVVDDTHRPAAVLGRRTFTVDNPNQYTHLIVELQADDGATVWINGDPVVAHGIADGAITADTLATNGVWGSAETEWNRFLVSPATLNAGANTIAVSVHQAWATSADLGFDLRLIGSTENATVQPPPNISVGAVVNPGAIVREYGESSLYLEGTVDPPANWTSSGFDDNTWTAATGILGFGENDINTTLNQGLTTYYMRADFELTAAQAVAPATIEMLRDDGVVVYVNGTEIGRDTMPPGPLDSTTVASGYIYGAAETTAIDFAVPTNVLQPGTNVVAVEVHQGHPDSRDLKAGFQIRSTP